MGCMSSRQEINNEEYELFSDIYIYLQNAYVRKVNWELYDFQEHVNRSKEFINRLQIKLL